MNQSRPDMLTRATLTSAIVTTVVTSVHHIYRLGLEFLLPALILVALLYVLMHWFRASRRPLALWSFTATNGIIFVWFGFIDGFLDHVLKALGLGHTTLLPGGEAEVVATVYSLWSPEAGNLFYEGTGVLTFLASVVALYYNYRLLRVFRTSGPTTKGSRPKAVPPHRQASSVPNSNRVRMSD
jgi:hypothetical protein